MVRFVFLLACACILHATPALSFVGSALQLDGRDAYVEVANTPALHSPRALSVTGWFRADGSPAEHGWQALFWKGDLPDQAPYGNREVGLWLSPSRHLRIASAPADSSMDHALMLDSQHTRIQPGRWHHFAVVINVDEESMRLFIDGRLDAEGGYGSSGIRQTTGPLVLGGIPGRDRFHGLLDEIRLWNRALTPADVAREMHTTLTQIPDGLLAAYTFDDLEIKGRVRDISGNNHHGRLVGGAHLTKIRVLSPPAATIIDSTLLAVVPARPAPVRSIRGAFADVLIDAFYSEDYRVRRKAAASFDHVALEDLPRVLSHGLRSEHYEVRSGAIDALARLDALAMGPGGEGQEMIVQTAALGDIPAATTALRHPRKHRRSRNLAAYLNWEERWQAPPPADLELESDGVVVRYNRVEGLYGGLDLPRTYRDSETLTHFGSIGYGLAARTLRYQVGGEIYTFYSPSGLDDHLATLGGELHDIVDTQDSWLVPEEENSVGAFLFRRDFRDYYRRRGWSAYTAHNVGGVLHLTGRYQWDEFHSLESDTDWGLFGGRYSRTDFRQNPAIDEVQIRSLRMDLQLDTRTHRTHARRGWLSNVLFERAGGFLGGEAQFKRYLADVRRYQPVSRGARIDLRLRLGTAKGNLPRQYLFDLGGLGSIRGYSFKEFTGDRMVLFNAEYWIDADNQWHGDVPADDLRLGAFLDTGTAWFASDRDDPYEGLGPVLGSGSVPSDPELRTSLGLGIGFGQSTRLYAARPLSGPEDWVLSFRISRAF